MSTSLRAGVARIDITPPVGVDLTGFIARQNPSEGVRDPLYVRALVLDDDDQQIALVSCDLLGLDRDLVVEVRDRIALATDIAAPQVMIACTHTHGGPATITLVDCGKIDPDYVETLLPRIVETVVEAQARLQAATLAVGNATTSAGVHNRRNPSDLIDPEVGLLRVDDAEGAPLAVVVNYTCHPTTLNHTNRRITADYPGLVTSHIEEATGAVALFLMGAIGDVGPITRGEESLATIGHAVADAALAALPGLASMPDSHLEVAGEMLHLPLLAIPTREQWNTWRIEYEHAAFAAESKGQPAEAKVQWALVHWTERMFEAMQEDKLSPTVNAEIQMIRVGDLVLIGVPGEYFVELGLQIKEGIRQSGVSQVMICGFANGNVGYIPARRAYALGGYEVADAYKYYGYAAALAPEAGEQIVAKAIELGQEEG
jgi:neutral ceramidase